MSTNRLSAKLNIDENKAQNDIQKSIEENPVEHVRSSTMMSYSPLTDYFALSLTRRLENLAPSGQHNKTSPPIEVTDTRRSIADDSLMGLEGETKEERLRKLLERGIRTCDGYVVKMSPAFPLPGTTFPPNRFVSSDLLRAKFQKDSNLLFQLHKNRNKMPEPEPELFRPSTEQEEDSTSHEACDSDLFFDFDIGSPEHPESDQVRIINTVNGMDIDQGSGSDSEMSASPTLLGQPSVDMLRHSPRSPEPSTAFGSTSSGLFSDPDTPSPSDREDNGVLDDFQGQSLHPEDWFKNQNMSKDQTPIISPTGSDVNVTMTTFYNSEDASPELNQDDVNCNTELSNHDDSETENGDLKVCIGNTEKSVAQSKLQALLAQLEHSYEYRQGQAAETGGFIRPLSPPEINSNLKPCTQSLKLVSTSPANFSFLVSSVQSQTDDETESSSTTTLSIESSPTVSTVPKSFSLPEISEYDKSYVAPDSPKPEVVVPEKPVEKQIAAKKELYRKCSSLRSGKTPPSTPGRRKIVRFADVFGLDLADVKTFLDEIPRVPKSAFKDLKNAELSDLESDSGSEHQFTVQPPTGPPTFPTSSLAATPTIAPLFNQPCGSSEFFNHLRDKKICLESAYMSDAKTVKGTIRVVNLDFNKRVLVRYSTDDWQTTGEVEGIYLNGSCDGFSDKFNFFIDYSRIAGMIGKRLLFCLKYECAGNEYWDNNFGRNYIFQVFGPSATRLNSSSTLPYRRSSSPRKKSPPMPAASTASSRMQSGPQFSTFSHSPSASDDPWLRYL